MYRSSICHSLVLRWFVLTVGLFAAADLMQPGAAIASDAGDFIRSTATEAIQLVAAKNISDGERTERFRALFSRTFDTPVIARFVLGRYWRKASDTQRHEYLQLFGEFVVQAYSFRFKDLSGKALRVGKSRELNARDTLVFSRFVRVNGEPVRVDWRVRRNGEKYRVVDVVVEGMSMLITQRDEFAAVINSAGGKIEGLLAALRRKTGKSR